MNQPQRSKKSYFFLATKRRNLHYFVFDTGKEVKDFEFEPKFLSSSRPGRSRLSNAKFGFHFISQFDSSCTKPFSFDFSAQIDPSKHN
jgi:hypothetical protein